MGTPTQVQVPTNYNVKLGYDISVEFSTESPSTRNKRSLWGGGLLEGGGLVSLLPFLPRGNSAPSWRNRCVKVTTGPRSWEYSRDVYPHGFEHLSLCNVSACEPTTGSGSPDYVSLSFLFLWLVPTSFKKWWLMFNQFSGPLDLLHLVMIRVWKELRNLAKYVGCEWGI
jgi:hypothetical protein